MATKIKFPYKLHDILSSPDLDKSILGWQPHGRCFRVNNVDEFTEKILPLLSCTKQCKTPKFSSFQRNLNVYGFIRLYNGPDRGCYYHELFVEGRKDLCCKVQRKKCTDMAQPLRDEPNFYAQEHEQWTSHNNRDWDDPSSSRINNVHMIPHPVIHPQQHQQHFYSPYDRDCATQSPINTIESTIDHVYNYRRVDYGSSFPSYRRDSIGSNYTEVLNKYHPNNQKMTPQYDIFTSDETFSSNDNSCRSNSPTATQVSYDNIDDILSLADDESLDEFFAKEVPAIAPVEPYAPDDNVDDSGSRDFETFMSRIFT